MRKFEKIKTIDFTRRRFLKSLLQGGMFLTASGIGKSAQSHASINSKEKGFIQTVTGNISISEMGFTLPHEHVMCDFIGADKVSKNRYEPDEVIAAICPNLEEIKKLGVKTFIDCTPAYIGRDVEILAELSKKTGLNILTNAGFYKEPYLPQFTWDVSADKLAEIWTKEILEGIEGTKIKAGFIKIAVNPGALIPIQKKIVTAACRTSKITGAVIASHTGKGIAAVEELDILEKENINPESFIYVHADSEPDIKYHFEAAKRGAWVEYDGIRKNSAKKVIKLILSMLDKGYEDRILLSQDSGWYRVGEPGGGK
ncbi:MAG TPA: phosphotriesterase, partial [bacterium]|nr:phosphotriesterase [bacterium]